jgi:hypothetical protein
MLVMYDLSMEEDKLRESYPIRKRVGMMRVENAARKEYGRMTIEHACNHSLGMAFRHGTYKC